MNNEWIRKLFLVQNTKDLCTPVFIAASFTTANIWKQSKCSSIEERIKKMRYRYTIDRSNRQCLMATVVTAMLVGLWIKCHLLKDISIFKGEILEVASSVNTGVTSLNV